MELEVKAYHLGQRIDLKRVRNKLKYSCIRNEHSYLLYQINHFSYSYIKDYGSVVFINCGKEYITHFLQIVVNSDIELDLLPNEKYKITISEDEEIAVDFDSIEIPDLTVDMAHIIMLNLGQSVALDNYSQMASGLLESIRIHSNQLEQTGNVGLNRKELRKFIGKTMNLKNRIAENLFIFDTSTLAWTTESLSNLDGMLRKELDILDRHQGLQHNLNTVKENLDLFKDIIQHRYSSILEWIIIFLILIEVVQLLIERII